MFKNYATAFYILTIMYQTQHAVNGAPYDESDHNSIIVIPFKSTENQITKIDSFKINGETAMKQLFTRVTAEKILRTLSNIQEFDILVEGLDAITLGDIYKSVFPNGILRSIEDKYMRSPALKDTLKPVNLENIMSTVDNKTEIPNDEVYVDDIQLEGLKEEPITDDYVYDQPFEDRFPEGVDAKESDEIENNDSSISKNNDFVPREEGVAEGQRKKVRSRYGANFRNWMTSFFTG